ncbi:MAG: hypothetical protein WD766_06695 [Gemmatimonadota bacterium]
MPAPRDRLSVRHEVGRKLIHAASVGVPLLAWFLPRPVALALLILGAVAAVGVEVARTRVRWARYHFLSRTRHLLRSGERYRISGATYMAVGYLIAFLLFPPAIAVVAMLYNGLGDAAAALVGKRWGRHRARWGKSLEGTAAGLLVNFAAGVVVPGIALPTAPGGAAAAALLEFLPLPLDDNLRVTLGGGLALWLSATVSGGAV